MSSFFDALHGAFHDPSRRTHQVVEAVVWVLIVVSVGLFAVEVTWGEPPLLAALDRLILWVFTVEVVLRIATFHPRELDFYDRGPGRRLWDHVAGRLRFALRPAILIDILTVLALVPLLRGLRALRLLRLVRTVRLFRYSNPFTGLVRSFEDNRLLYSFVLSWIGFVVALGGVSIWLVDRDDPASGVRTVADGMYWALVTLTTVGYGDISPNDPVGRLIAGGLMIAGMFTLALFAGVVGQTLLGAVLSIREEQFRMSGYIDHVVICGYDDGSRMLVDALLAEVDAEVNRVVVFAPRSRPPSLPVEVTWVEGDPTKESELDKARITHARAVIVVGGRQESPQHADANSILTVFTVRRYLRRKPDPGRTTPLYVVCEVLDSENVEHARAAGADEVIESNRLGFSLLAHAIVEPGTARVIGQVAVPGEQNVYVGRLPEGLDLPMPFADVARHLHTTHGCLVIGVRRGRSDAINPPHDRVVSADDRVLYLARRPALPA